ncbi:helix-turn-helix transcriptional regulator [Sporosarcina cascadiensis]|uniref:helix-turn-helix transcriptional regulator n=1 Tax=Sporosarcina cascadiensis TaxID=2660747 RepID=UPI00129B234F|nr:helix-turn-helix transcriptional regulator [Sporosarcina cascadiensis]
MLNISKVKGRMMELGFSQKDLANMLGVSLPTVNQKINNKRPLYLKEVLEIARLLQIKETELASYFFRKEVAYCNKEADEEVASN